MKFGIKYSIKPLSNNRYKNKLNNITFILINLLINLSIYNFFKKKLYIDNNLLKIIILLYKITFFNILLIKIFLNKISLKKNTIKTPIRLQIKGNNFKKRFKLYSKSLNLFLFVLKIFKFK
jgi:hypothetical protein